MPLVTQAEFARLLGVAKPYVNKLVTQGVLTLDADGKLDYDGSLAILKARASPGHQLSRASADDTPAMREIRSAGGEEPHSDAPPAPESVGAGSFQQARTQREHYAALNERVKYEREIGRQVDRAGVDRACKTAARLIRDNIMAVPDQISATLAAETDPKKVHALLFKALREALNRTLGGLETPVKPTPVDDEPTAH